ncbi:MBL fold metallo-hydrolase [Nocardia coffeae]|uniref:MBL fold metallo-hydrolase n=1 Tax=Nocardia coffeae TaxID=2873381 RepID=UPI001F462D3D|nr:MBL fold metallo-hydrolase [Nocardia coffeae]
MGRPVSIRIGEIDLLPIVDGVAHEPLSEVVAHDVGADWCCPGHPVDADGRIELGLGGYLVRTGDRIVLVDAGMGQVDKPSVQAGGLLGGLRAAGVEPTDVTDVLFTHLHWDHVGWSTQQGEVIFTRATHRVHAADWEYFVSGPLAVPGAVRKLSPLQERIEPFDTETELVPGIVARPAPGHTPGSTIFVVAGGGERALLLGDVVHAIGELTDPQWHGLYDLDPVGAREVRDRLADEALDSAALVAAGHFPGLGLGRLVTAAGGRRFVPVT